MRWIDWIAIEANLSGIATVDETLQRIMTGRAQGSQLVELEFAVITSVRSHMIGDGRAGNAAFRQTEGAKRLDPQLVSPTILPFLQAI